MIVAITGHRPERIGNENLVLSSLKIGLDMLNPEAVIVGMAEGADLMAAGVALELGIPVWAYRPWKTHGRNSAEAQRILKAATKVKVINEVDEYKGPWMYHDRNRAMVDDADVVVAVWDGQAGGGTHATVAYALAHDKTVFAINSDTGRPWTVNDAESL